MKVTNLLLTAGNPQMGGPPTVVPWVGGKQPWAFLHRLLLLWHQDGRVHLVEG